MAKRVHPDVLDGGLQAIRTAATALHIIRAYTAGDSYATVLGNSCGNAALALGDFALADGAAGARVLTLAAKTTTATAASGPAPDLHLAVVDAATQRVLWVTDETTNLVVAVGNQLAVPALTYTTQQPV